MNDGTLCDSTAYDLYESMCACLNMAMANGIRVSRMYEHYWNENIP